MKYFLNLVDDKNTCIRIILNSKELIKIISDIDLLIRRGNKMNSSILTHIIDYTKWDVNV